MHWPFDTTFTRELPWLGVPATPVPVRQPTLLALNDELAVELGLDPAWLRSDDGVAVLAGNAAPDGVQPVAQGYAGHQFGQFSPLLGDGRAHLLGEVVDREGRRRDIALKGSGRTAFSRGGDGRAVVGPVLREYLVGEAMHALGIPTTRALAAVGTGETVMRQRPEPGAILTRVASSHLRVGSVELLRTRGGPEHLTQLIEYVRARHYPELPAGSPLALLSAVVERQAELIAAWMSVGFIHGVMNTDNMSLSGETIDYGPCAFMDTYDPHTVFSSIDQLGRYRYGAQPSIAVWNLSRLAEALLPACEGDPNDLVPEATSRIEAFVDRYDAARLTRYRAKLGLADEDAGDEALVAGLQSVMKDGALDFTLTFRRLAAVVRGDADAVRAHLGDHAAYDIWEGQWLARVGEADRAAVADRMDAVNPLHIPRNHLVEEALEAARTGDLGPFETLLEVVRSPYAARPGMDSGWERYADPAPTAFTASYVTFCGT